MGANGSETEVSLSAIRPRKEDACNSICPAPPRLYGVGGRVGGVGGRCHNRLVFDIGDPLGVWNPAHVRHPGDVKLRDIVCANALRGHSHICAEMPPSGFESATVEHAADAISQLTKYPIRDPAGPTGWSPRRVAPWLHGQSAHVRPPKMASYALLNAPVRYVRKFAKTSHWRRPFPQHGPLRPTPLRNLQNGCGRAAAVSAGGHRILQAPSGASAGPSAGPWEIELEYTK